MARYLPSKDKRLTYIKKWIHRASKTEDVFDQFFCLWIAAVIAARRFGTQHPELSPPGDENGDRNKVIAYFSGNCEHVVEALNENKPNMMRLARRRGTDYHGPIVDTRNPDLRRKFDRLVAHYTQSPILPRRELAEVVGELLNKIRNNVFHGVKVYDDAEDVALLKLVNPILRAILRRCEGL